jgi:hypothetical protein
MWLNPRHCRNLDGLINECHDTGWLISKEPIQYAHEVAAKDGVELATAASAWPLFEQSVEEGHGNQDLSTVVEPLHNDR